MLLLSRWALRLIGIFNLWDKWSEEALLTFHSSNSSPSSSPSSFFLPFSSSYLPFDCFCSSCSLRLFMLVHFVNSYSAFSCITIFLFMSFLWIAIFRPYMRSNIPYNSQNQKSSLFSFTDITFEWCFHWKHLILYHGLVYVCVWVCVWVCGTG